MNRIARNAFFAIVILVAALPSEAAKTLAVPAVGQMPQTNWCWAASTQAILSYTGNAPGMCTIVNHIRVLRGWGNDDCCTNGTGAICNQPNSLAGFGSAQTALKNWGADSEYIGSSLSLARVTETIDDDSPSIVEWRPNNGSTVGHAVVLHGYSGSSMTIMDPMQGITSMPYSALVANVQFLWRGTLLVKPLKITYVVDDTGSMSDDIASVKNTILAQIGGYASEGRFAKYTLVTYKDSVNFVGSTTDGGTITDWIEGLSASGGGDCPEEGYDALDRAAEEAPRSEVWWMTDADSHGGFLRMLLTRARLLLARCTLHSTILGACTAPALAATSQVHSSGVSPSDIAASRALTNSDVSAITAGEALSTATGGLFFTTSAADLASATRIITEEMGSDAVLSRRAYPAGSFVTSVPVDASVTLLKITLDISGGAAGAIAVKDPSGVTLTPGSSGVDEIVAGASRMLLVTPPALATGAFEITTTSSMPYFLSVSAASSHDLNMIGDSSAGIGTGLTARVEIATLRPRTFSLGPGTGAAARDASADSETIEFPYDRSKLKFYREGEDGSGRTEVTLFDDGLHGDDDQNDGVFAGSIVFGVPGEYRLVATVAESLFERATKVLISVGEVSLSTPADRVGRPATTVNHSFTLLNLTATANTFDIGISSDPPWAVTSGAPTQVTLAPGASSTFVIPVAIPPGAERGDLSLLGVTVVAQDDPSISDSVFVRTNVWTGPLLQTIDGSPAARGGTLMLVGAGFGADPGAGNRGSTSHHVLLAGATVPSSNVTAWSDTAIQMIVPTDAVSGLLNVVAALEESNQLAVNIIAAAASLTISKETETVSAQSGSLLTYTITYNNTGDEDATGVIVRETIPSGATFVSATEGGTFSSGAVTWMIGTLPAGTIGETVSFTVLVTALSGATVQNNTYSIEAAGIPPIAGPAVSTPVAATLADVPLATNAGLLIFLMFLAITGVFLVGRLGKG